MASSEEGRLIVRTTSAIVHPGYNSNNLNNDIALIQLPSPIEFSGNIYFNYEILKFQFAFSNHRFLKFTDRIQPVALASSDFEVGAGVAVTASGWGRTSDRK